MNQSIFSIGRAIRFLRLGQGLGQPELAERAGLSVSYLSLLERGKRDPATSTVIKIADALGVPLLLLVYVADPNQAPADAAPHLAQAVIELAQDCNHD